MSEETCNATIWNNQIPVKCPSDSKWKCEWCDEHRCENHGFTSGFILRQGTQVHCDVHIVCWDCHSTLLSVLNNKSGDYSWKNCCMLLRQYKQVQQ